LAVVKTTHNIDKIEAISQNTFKHQVELSPRSTVIYILSFFNNRRRGMSLPPAETAQKPKIKNSDMNKTPLKAR